MPWALKGLHVATDLVTHLCGRDHVVVNVEAGPVAVAIERGDQQVGKKPWTVEVVHEPCASFDLSDALLAGSTGPGSRGSSIPSSCRAACVSGWMASVICQEPQVVGVAGVEEMAADEQDDGHLEAPGRRGTTPDAAR